MKIVFTGGGTGGHIFPILAVVREIKKIYAEKPRRENLNLFYIGPKDEYGLELLALEGVRIKKIITGKFRRYFSLKNFLDILKFPIGFFQALFWFFVLFPDLIFSKGGHGSFPVALAGKLLSTPLILHESDAIPGLASKIESRWAKEIFTSFPGTESLPRDKMVLVGNPVRKEITGGSKEKAKDLFKLQGKKPLILILGGSQGSRMINEVTLEILPNFLKDFEIIHQTGKKNFKGVKAEADAIVPDKFLKKYYHPVSFLNEDYLKQALSAADLVVSRAGSGSIFEIAAAGKPAILIPLGGAAQNHQAINAFRFKESGGGEVFEEKNFRPHYFLERLRYLFSQEEDLKKMAEASKQFARTRAAPIIASYLIEYLTAIKSAK